MQRDGYTITKHPNMTIKFSAERKGKLYKDKFFTNLFKQLYGYF